MSLIEFTKKTKEKRKIKSFAWACNGNFMWTCPVCKTTHLDTFVGVWSSVDEDGDLPAICSCSYKSFIDFKYLCRYGKK